MDDDSDAASTGNYTKLVIAAAFGGFAGFFLLFPVVPAIAEPLGGPFGAGAATGVLGIGTVGAQLMSPFLLRQLGYKNLFVVGLALLGVPALAYGRGEEVLWLILLITLLRGFGFGILTVVPPALIAGTVSDAVRSSSLGVYGFFMAAAGSLGPAVGLLLFDTSSVLVAIVGGAFPIAGAVLLLVQRIDAPAVLRIGWRQLTFVEAGRLSKLSRPLVGMLPGSIMYAGFYSFVPLWVDGGAPAALATFGLSFALGRLIGGKAEPAWPGLTMLGIGALAAAGGVGLVFISGGIPLIVGSALAGGGVGVMSISSLLEALKTVKEDQLPVATAAWAVSFDSGLAAGGLVLGAVAVVADYDTAFLFAIGLLFLGTYVAMQPSRRVRSRLEEPAD